jgi:hypothetical protein
MYACILISIVGSSACKEKSQQQPPAPTLPSAPPAVAAGVAVFADDQRVTSVERTKAESWPRLDSLLPTSAQRYGTWAVIRGERAAGPFEIKKPGSLYGALVPALYPASSGKGVSLGFFDPVELARKGPPKVSFDDLSSVRVELDKGGARGQNDHMGGDVSDPKTLKLRIEHGGTTIDVSGEQLLGLPQDLEPDDDSGEHKGWKLSSILTMAKVPAPKRALLTGADLNLTLEAQDLDPNVAVPFIKLNRQGQLRYRTYKKSGDGWTVSGDLRGLTKIQVLQ